jgi:hypothetical protein
MNKPPLFELGFTVQTANALATLDPVSVMKSIKRHQTGDWGDCCPEDARENDRALKEKNRIFSVYKDSNNVKFWIITEHDRSVTTVLLPEDY